MKGVPKKQWGDDPDFISIPRDLVAGGRSVLIRSGTAASNLQNAKGLEETLNHIFDLALSLMPESTLGSIFHSAIGIDDVGPFERWGRELAPRFWTSGNVTQHDGFVSSQRSVLAIELKLGSSK